MGIKPRFTLFVGSTGVPSDAGRTLNAQRILPGTQIPLLATLLGREDDHTYYAPGDGNKSRLKRDMYARTHTSPKSKRHRKVALYFAIPIAPCRVVWFEESRGIERLRVLE